MKLPFLNRIVEDVKTLFLLGRSYYGEPAWTLVLCIFLLWLSVFFTSAFCVFAFHQH